MQVDKYKTHSFGKCLNKYYQMILDSVEGSTSVVEEKQMGYKCLHL